MASTDSCTDGGSSVLSVVTFGSICELHEDKVDPRPKVAVKGTKPISKWSDLRALLPERGDDSAWFVYTTQNPMDGVHLSTALWLRACWWSFHERRRRGIDFGRDPTSAPPWWAFRERLRTGIDSCYPALAPRWFQRLWAVCQRRRRRISLDFIEFADLSDGRRVVVRDDRGTGWSCKRREDPWRNTSAEQEADYMRDAIEQFEEDRPCSPEWVVEQIRDRYGIEVDLMSVEVALTKPRRIEVGERLRQHELGV